MNRIVKPYVYRTDPKNAKPATVTPKAKPAGVVPTPKNTRYEPPVSETNYLAYHSGKLLAQFTNAVFMLFASDEVGAALSRILVLLAKVFASSLVLSLIWYLLIDINLAKVFATILVGYREDYTSFYNYGYKFIILMCMIVVLINDFTKEQPEQTDPLDMRKNLK
jgi:uncharacterized membrane protein